MSSAGLTGVVQDIFTTVHGRYDFMNHLLSLRRDVGWREVAISRMRFPGAGRLLDVATGTADLAIAAARHHPDVAVVGLDFAEPMLRVGRRKVQEAGLSRRIELIMGDACALPFPDRSFNVTAVAFGMRNMPDKLAALREMARVTAAGGQVMVLEMTFAPSQLFRPIYGFYLGVLLPRMARILARNEATYFYLGDSIRHFPAPHLLASLMRQAGLQSVRWCRLTFGTAYLHIGKTPGGT
jgi:demethylmenaquinone methyltransferase/2-methoxy-6-polyprenyl-1,4-benzoquinol methylase